MKDNIRTIGKAVEKLELHTEEGRAAAYKKYKPLMHKISNQFVGRLPLSFDDIMGAAYEGFTLAMNKYVSGTSQSFQQYAAWCMRNAILTSANTEGHTIKLSAYQQQKVKDRGDSTFLCVPMSSMVWDSDDDGDRFSEFGYTCDPMAESDSSVMWDFYNWMLDNFSLKERTIFYHAYGLNGYDAMRGTDIAKMLNVSTACVSVTNKRILSAIRGDEKMLDRLRDMIQ